MSDGVYVCMYVLQLMYAVMLREWKLTQYLVKSDLEPNCPSCQHLKPQILLQVLYSTAPITALLLSSLKLTLMVFFTGLDSYFLH